MNHKLMMAKRRLREAEKSVLNQVARYVRAIEIDDDGRAPDLEAAEMDVAKGDNRVRMAGRRLAVARARLEKLRNGGR